jgi:hypothetical protein
MNGLTDTHEAQIAAFCRHYGSWSSPKVRYTEWNLELIESMVDDMSRRWDHLNEGFEKTFDCIEDAINTEVDKLAAGVKGTKSRFAIVPGVC